MKKNRKIITLISTIALIGLALTATFAWFFTYNTLEIQNNNDIICEASSSIKIRAKHSYDNAFSPFDNKVSLINKAVTVKDITGNGVELYSATELDSVDNETYNPLGFVPAKAVNENGVGDYIELNVQISSKNQVDIYLDEESSVVPVGDGFSDHNPFAHNNFSADYISAAMRIAVIVDGNLKTIWAPNPQYIINKNPDNGKYVLADLLGKDNGANDNLLEANNFYKDNPHLRNPEKYNYYIDNTGTIQNHIVNIDEYATKKFVMSSTKIKGDYPYLLDKNPFSPILTTIIPPSIGQDGVSDLTLRIWFEGCDREANEALAGGKVKINLKFKGENSKANYELEHQNLITKIKYNPNTSKFYDGTAGDALNNLYNDKLIYSINGFDWYYYNSLDTSPTALSTFEKSLKVTGASLGRTIYFKLPETEKYYEFICKLDNLEYTGGGYA